jgi:acyl-coenzyme A thioesterase PaaI-like protein
MNPKEMTGLQLLQAMCAGQIPPASISETIPMDLHSISKGGASFNVKADQRHLNPLGGVHGGFAATVLDSVTGCAVHTTLEAGVGYGTIDLKCKTLSIIILVLFTTVVKRNGYIRASVNSCIV